MRKTKCICEYSRNLKKSPCTKDSTLQYRLSLAIVLSHAQRKFPSAYISAYIQDKLKQNKAKQNKKTGPSREKISKENANTIFWKISFRYLKLDISPYSVKIAWRLLYPRSRYADQCKNHEKCGCPRTGITWRSWNGSKEYKRSTLMIYIRICTLYSFV